MRTKYLLLEQQEQKQQHEEDFLTAMTRLAAIARPSPVLLTFTNAGQADFIKSFLCNLGQVGGAAMQRRLVVVVPDRRTRSSLAAFSPEVTLVLRPWAGEQGHLRFGTGQYMDFIEYRTQAVLEVVQAGLQVVLVDADHYWTRDPVPWIGEQQGYDIITENAHFEPLQFVCGGFLYLNSTPATQQLWSKVTQQTKFFRSFPETSSVNEQDVMTRILPEITRGGRRRGGGRAESLWATADLLYPPPAAISWRFLPSDRFAPGRWYFPEHAKERRRPVWSVHNNWVVGNVVKIERARRFGHWFYNETCDCCLNNVVLG